MKHLKRKLLETHLNEIATKGFNELVEEVLSSMIQSKHSNRIAIVEIALPIIKAKHTSTILAACSETRKITITTLPNVTKFCTNCMYYSQPTTACGSCRMDVNHPSWIARDRLTTEIVESSSNELIFLDFSSMSGEDKLDKLMNEPISPE